MGNSSLFSDPETNLVTICGGEAKQGHPRWTDLEVERAVVAVRNPPVARTSSPE